MSEGGEQFGWDAFVPLIVHPMKVEIIEALLWIREPLSATLLTRLFEEQVYLNLVAYHLGGLAKFGMVTKVGDRQVRGAVESFYALNDEYLRRPVAS